MELKRIRAITSLLRLNNLLIIIFTQVLFYFFFLLPALRLEGFTPVLAKWDAILFLTITPLIAAGGNIINDISDHPTDVLNKKRRSWKQLFSPATVWHLYWASQVIAVVIAAYLAIRYQRWISFSLVPMGILVLALYSRWLKFKPFVGNALISLMCGSVVWVLFLPDLDAWGLTLTIGQPPAAVWIAAVFGLLAASANFLREWAKDMEDLPGDKESGAKTLAVILPRKISARMLQICILIWIICLAIGLYNPFFHLRTIEWWLSFCILILPLFILIFLIEFAHTRKDWHRISLSFKYYMGMGLILACILKLL